MTLTFDHIVARAITAIRRADRARDDLADMTPREIREMHEAAVMAEFQALSEWRVCPHRLPGTYVIRNTRTRAFYQSGARGGSKKTVVFKRRVSAQARANELNVAEDATAT